MTPPVAPPACYVHSGRPAGSVCRRCGQPICPECMHEAPVGWQCTRCVREGARESPSTRWRPPARAAGGLHLTPVVIAIIVANVAAYGWEAHNRYDVINRFAVQPFDVHYRHEWYRLLTGAFLHANFQHIFFNMLTLAFIGPAVEVALGRLRFALIYLLSALGGSLASYLMGPLGEFGIGASGAIFGVMGAFYILARLKGWDLRQITTLVVLNLVISFVPGSGIDWRAHIGGLVTGAIVCLGLIASPARPVPGARRRWITATDRPADVTTVVQSLAVVVGVVALLGALLQIAPGQVSL